VASDTVTLIVAGVGFAGAVTASFVSRLQERRQQTRTLLTEHADVFAKATHSALAELRHVTPPRWPAPQPHRNEILLHDLEERQRRLDRVRDALDEVRAARASLPMFFGTRSWVAECGAQILGSLRASIEAAEKFYYLADEADSEANSPADNPWWQGEDAQKIRTHYKSSRLDSYVTLGHFYDHVIWRTKHPHSEGKKVPESQSAASRRPS
jgi:hypothetical protein